MASISVSKIGAVPNNSGGREGSWTRFVFIHPLVSLGFARNEKSSDLNAIYYESERKARTGKSYLAELAGKVKKIDPSLAPTDLFRALHSKWASGASDAERKYAKNIGVGVPGPALSLETSRALVRLAKEEDWSWTDPAFHVRHRAVSADDLALVPGISAETIESARKAIGNGFDMSIMPMSLLLPTELLVMKYVPKADYFEPKPTSDHDPYGILAESIAYSANVKDTNGQQRRIIVFSQKFRDTALVNINGTCCHGCVGCYKSYLTREGEGNIKRYGLSSEVLLPQMDELVKELNKRPLVDQLILSGGEPLLFSNSQLKEVLGKLKRIRNLRILRVCTGTAFQGEPFRIDDELIGMFKKFSEETGIRVKFNVHLNHPDQITPEALWAIKRLSNAGICAYAQVPIQVGINFFPDDIEKSVELWTKLNGMVERLGENYKMIVDMHPRTDGFIPPLEKVIEVLERAFNSHEYSDNKQPKTVAVLCRQGNLILYPGILDSMEKRVDEESGLVKYYWLVRGPSGKLTPVKYVEPLTKDNSDPNSIAKLRERRKGMLLEAVRADEGAPSAEERSKVFAPIGSEWREKGEG